MKRYTKKINHDDIVDALKYLYLSNRYFNLLELHKENEKVSNELKMKWADEYVQNSIKYTIKSYDIMVTNGIPIGQVGRFEFNLEEDLIDYCLKEIDNA